MHIVCQIVQVKTPVVNNLALDSFKFISTVKVKCTWKLLSHHRKMS